MHGEQLNNNPNNMNQMNNMDDNQQ